MFGVTKDKSQIYYEIGYSNDNALLLSNGTDRWLLTDGRYFEEAKESSRGCEVILSSSKLAKDGAKLIRASKIKSVAFEPNGLTYAEYETLQKYSLAKLLPKKGFFSKKRAIKSEDELKKIKTAAKLGREGFRKFADTLNSCKKTVDEKRAYHLAIDAMSFGGNFEISFDPIVAISENAANPHAKPSDKKLKSGSLLLFDAGVKYEKYCSDRTRTVYFEDGFEFKKNHQRFKDQKIQLIYDTVLRAQECAINGARAGMSAKELDKKAREVIEKAGFGEYFVHSLGHGVGLDIHEYPYINKRSDDVLEENMVFTVEPGIYIPGFCGVRIEDMVVIKNSKAEVL